MVRVKRGNVARNRRKKILKFAKGFKGAHSRLFRTANGQVMKALVYSYVGRKRRKQDFRKLWILLLEVALVISAPIFLASSMLREAQITVADCAASCFTVAKPIPEVVPVTI